MDFQLMLENAQDENERKDLIMFEAWDVAVKKAMFSLDTYNKLQELERRGRQVKYLAENVSEDTDKLTAFYEEESSSAEVVAKRKSLIRRIWEAIKKRWREIKKKISDTMAKARLDKQVPDESEGVISKEALSLPEKISQMIMRMKSFVGTHKAESLTLLIGSITAVIAAILAIRKCKDLVRINGAKFKDFLSRLRKSTDPMEQAIDHVSKVEEKEVEILQNPLSPSSSSGPKDNSGKLSKKDIDDYRAKLYNKEYKRELVYSNEHLPTSWADVDWEVFKSMKRADPDFANMRSNPDASAKYKELMYGNGDNHFTEYYLRPLINDGITQISTLEMELIGQYINQMTVPHRNVIDYVAPLPAPAAYDDYNENADDDSVNNIIESILSGNL